MRAELLREGNIRRFVTARALSRAGDAVYPVGLTAALLHAGYGASAVGLVLAAATGPVVLLMLVGGALLDRVQPRTPMIVADFTRFLVQGGIALLFLTGRPALGHIIALSLCAGVAQAFYQPGVATMLKELATAGLREANALVRTAESIVGLAAPALAGLAVTVSGASSAIALDAFSYAASAWLLWRIRVVPAPRPRGAAHLLRDLGTGWREFSSLPWLWTVVTTFTLLGLLTFGPYDVLKSVVLISRWGATAYGLLLSAYALGTVAGGLLALRTAPRRPLLSGVLALSALVPLPAAIALDAPVVLVALAMACGGTGYAFWAVTWATAVQSHAPTHAMGRISAYDVIGSTCLIPVGRALSGPAAAWWGSATVLLGSSLFLLLGCAVLLCVPAVTGMRQETEAESGERRLVIKGRSR